MDLSPLLPFLFDHFGEAFLFLVFVGWPLLQSILASRAKKEQQRNRPRRERRPRRSSAPGEVGTEAFDELGDLPADASPGPIDGPIDGPIEDDAPAKSGQEMWRELLEGMGVPEEAIDTVVPGTRTDEVPEPAPAVGPSTAGPAERSAPATLAEDFPDFVPSTLGQDTSGSTLLSDGGLPSSSLGELPELASELGGLGSLGGDLAVDLPSEIRGAPDAPAPAPGTQPAPGTRFERPTDPEDWRRAVILSEVLGPPLCEREPGVGTAPGLGL